MAASNINVVVLTGNLTRDPELRSTPSGTSVCKLRVAVNSRRKDGQTGEWVDKPNYFDVTVWGAQGENCATYLSKGRPVAVEGRLDWHDWEDNDGNKRQGVEIIANSVQFLGSRDGSGTSSGRRRRKQRGLQQPEQRRARGHVGLREHSGRGRHRRGRRHSVLRPVTRRTRAAVRRGLSLDIGRIDTENGQNERNRSAGPASRTPGAGPGAAPKVHPDQLRGRRLQGPRPAAPLPLRQGEDTRPPRHGALAQAPAAALDSGEAGSRNRPPALRGRAVGRNGAGHSSRGRREPRAARRSSRRLPGLPSELPRSPQARRTGHGGCAGGGSAPSSGRREGRARAGRARAEGGLAAVQDRAHDPPARR